MAKKKQAAPNRKKIESRWLPIGSVTVDTGILLLVAPDHAADFEDVPDGVDGEVRCNDQEWTAVVTSTGMYDGNYLVEGRYHEGTDLLAEIRVRFLDEKGNQAGSKLA